MAAEGQSLWGVTITTDLRHVGLTVIMLALLAASFFASTGHSAAPETWPFGDSVLYFTSPGCTNVLFFERQAGD
ncbi:MAG: hypothetical protein DDT35_00816 [Firmicutes bacterium]|nr:hypothetical protein [Bacillota bacterium]